MWRLVRPHIGGTGPDSLTNSCHGHSTSEPYDGSPFEPDNGRFSFSYSDPAGRRACMTEVSSTRRPQRSGAPPIRSDEAPNRLRRRSRSSAVPRRRCRDVPGGTELERSGDTDRALHWRAAAAHAHGLVCMLGPMLRAGGELQLSLAAVPSKAMTWCPDTVPALPSADTLTCGIC